MNPNELDITDFFNNAAPRDYSASEAEIGRDAGKATWGAACEDSREWPLLDTDEKRDAFRRHVMDFGAWTPEEIGTWSDTELNALLLQMIAGDMRDYCDSAEGWDWEEYEKGAERGTYSGRICRGDGGRVYYYIGS
jgi:hypothetical protein